MLRHPMAEREREREKERERERESSIKIHQRMEDLNQTGEYKESSLAS